MISIRNLFSLTWHDAMPAVKIIEPFIQFDGMSFEKKDDRTIIIQMKERKLELRNAQWQCRMDNGQGC